MAVKNRLKMISFSAKDRFNFRFTREWETEIKVKAIVKSELQNNCKGDRLRRSDQVVRRFARFIACLEIFFSCFRLGCRSPRRRVQSTGAQRPGTRQIPENGNFYLLKVLHNLLQKNQDLLKSLKRSFWTGTSGDSFSSCKNTGSEVRNAFDSLICQV